MYLAPEVWSLIFCKCELKDHLHIRLVCKEFKQLINTLSEWPFLHKIKHYFPPRSSWLSAANYPTQISSFDLESTILLIGWRQRYYFMETCVYFINAKKWNTTVKTIDWIKSFVNETMISELLFYHPLISSAILRDIFSEGEYWWYETRIEFSSLKSEFFSHFRLTNKQFFDAFLLLQSKMPIPSDYGHCVYLFQNWAEYLCNNLTDKRLSEDNCDLLCFITIMLSTDMYNNQINNKLSKERVVTINKEANIPVDVIEQIYQRMCEDSLKITLTQQAYLKKFLRRIQVSIKVDYYSFYVYEKNYCHFSLCLDECCFLKSNEEIIISSPHSKDFTVCLNDRNEANFVFDLLASHQKQSTIPLTSLPFNPFTYLLKKLEACAF